MKSVFFGLSLLLSVSALPFATFAQDVAATPAASDAGNTNVTNVPAAPNGENVAAPDAPANSDVIVAAVPPAEPNSMIPQPTTAIEKEIGEQISFQKPTVNPNLMPSLFFTAWEHDLIVDARRGLTTRMPGTDDGVQKKGPRDVSLAGIVYRSPKDWTIWLNDLRVSPLAIPDEVMDIKVFKDYIELEWFDENTNQIFPIRLRPHQRFNLDTRMFLPG